MARLAVLPNMVGVKDATGDLARASLMRLMCGEDFIMLSGDDPTAVGYMAHGGHGLISVTSNVAPRASAERMNAAMAGDFKTALMWQDRLMRLVEADAAAPVGQGSQPPGLKDGSVRGRIEDDEVVPDAMHLREIDAHRQQA